jgi:hypothetical protein
MNNRTLTNILLGLLIIILILIGYFFLKPEGCGDKCGPKNEDEIERVADNISITNRYIKESTTSYDINVAYPQISGMANTNIETKINSDLESFAKKAVEDFKFSETDTSVEVNIGAGKSTYEMNFEKVNVAVSVPIISFSFGQEFYSSGAAHPGHVFTALNYNLETGNKVTLKNIFTGNYLKVISDESIKRLNQKMGSSANQDQVKSGAGQKEENFVVFFPTPSGLKIIFNEYQVAGYAAGSQEITIPYSVLKPVINSSGPLKSL